MNKNIKFLSFFFLLTVFNSCFEGINNLELKTDAKIALPIAYGSFSVDEIIGSIEGADYLQSGKDSNFVFIYADPSFKVLDLNELIDVVSDIELYQIHHQLGLISIDDATFDESMTLGELKEKLPEVTELSLLEDKEYSVFPEINYSGSIPDVPEFLLIDNSIDFSEAVFSSGDINLNIENNFPVSVKGKITLFDQGTFSQTIEFGSSSSAGLLSGEGQNISIDLAGQRIALPISYRLDEISTSESSNSILIDFEKDIRISGKLESLQISKGILNRKKLELKMPVDEFVFDLINDVVISNAEIDYGTLELRFDKNIEEDILLSVEFLQITENGSILDLEIQNDTEGEITKQMSFNNIILDLCTDENLGNAVPYKLNMEINSADKIHFDSESFIDLGVSVKDFHISKVEGDFGRQSFPFPEVLVDLKIDAWDRINENLVITDPVLKLFVDNPFGFSSSASVKVEGVNRNAQKANVEIDNIILDYPKTDKEGFLSTAIEFNNSNSSLGTLISLPPDSILNISGELEINLDSDVTMVNKNFIDFEKKINIGYELTIPIVLKGSIYNLTDTLSWSVSMLDSISGSYVICSQITNKIPFKIELALTPFNSKLNRTTGDTIILEAIEAAEVDVDGNVLKSRQMKISKTLSKEEVKSIQDANSVLVNIVILSPEDGSIPAKLKSSNSIDFSVYVELDADKE